MDSLTQIVLGAAAGEAVAGRRIGNRAMMWGAIGGTIPDLDVVANLWMREIDALAVHRGITHSVFFSVVAPLVLGWLIHRLYSTGTHRSPIYKWIIGGLNIVLIVFIVSGNYWMTGSIPGLAALGLIGGYLIWRLYKFYIKPELEEVSMSFGRWYLLFFMAFFTHILLDCFTAYGTQAMLPFSNYRVAFNTISVVDPGYTIPFLVCLIAAAIHRRSDPARRFLNWLGIALSSLYLIVTISTKERVNRVFESSLEDREIQYQRYRTSPSILNNILWSCTAEGDTAFYSGLYSLYDSGPGLHYINVLEKDTASIARLDGFEEFETLRWFSDDYFLVRPVADSFEFADIRYGAMGDTITSLSDFVFRFTVVQHQSRLEVHQVEERPGDDDFGKLWNDYIDRILGH